MQSNGGAFHDGVRSALFLYLRTYERKTFFSLTVALYFDNI